MDEENEYQEWADRWNNALSRYGKAAQYFLSLPENQRRPYKFVLESFMDSLPQETYTIIASEGYSNGLSSPEFRYWFKDKYGTFPTEEKIAQLDQDATKRNYEYNYPGLSYDNRDKDDFGLHNATLALNWRRNYGGLITAKRLKKFDTMSEEAQLNNPNSTLGMLHQLAEAEEKLEAGKKTLGTHDPVWGAARDPEIVRQEMCSDAWDRESAGEKPEGVSPDWCRNAYPDLAPIATPQPIDPSRERE